MINQKIFYYFNLKGLVEFKTLENTYKPKSNNLKDF